MKLCENPKCKWHQVEVSKPRTGRIYLPSELGGGSIRRMRVGDSWLCECCSEAVKVALKTPVAWRYCRKGLRDWIVTAELPESHPEFYDVPLFQVVGCENCQHQLSGGGGCSVEGGHCCGEEYSDWAPRI